MSQKCQQRKSLLVPAPLQILEWRSANERFPDFPDGPASDKGSIAWAMPRGSSAEQKQEWSNSTPRVTRFTNPQLRRLAGAPERHDLAARLQAPDVTISVRALPYLRELCLLARVKRRVTDGGINGRPSTAVRSQSVRAADAGPCADRDHPVADQGQERDCVWGSIALQPSHDPASVLCPDDAGSHRLRRWEW